MKKNKCDILLIILFIIMLTFPSIIYWLFNKNEDLDISTTENRVLNPKPKLELATITEFPKQFDNYYNDHLPFRTMFRNCWTNLNYNLFNTTAADNVIIGKEGWLFYRGNKSIELVQGILTQSKQEQIEIQKVLQTNIDRFKNNNNAETYVLLLPNKENIYKEYLPSIIPIDTNFNLMEEFINYLKNNSNIKIVYPKQELLEVKEKYQIYKKYDTHWNKVGSCIGTIALQKEIDNNFSYNIDDINVNTSNDFDTSKDLAVMAGLENKFYEPLFTVDNFYPDIKYSVEEKELYDEYTSNSQNNKTVLCIGDSFLDNMKCYFSKLYSKVIYSNIRAYNPSILEEIKPDIVVIETVERYSMGILNRIYINE